MLQERCRAAWQPYNGPHSEKGSCLSIRRSRGCIWLPFARNSPFLLTGPGTSPPSQGLGTAGESRIHNAFPGPGYAEALIQPSAAGLPVQPNGAGDRPWPLRHQCRVKAGSPHPRHRPRSGRTPCGAQVGSARPASDVPAPTPSPRATFARMGYRHDRLSRATGAVAYVGLRAASVNRLGRPRQPGDSRDSYGRLLSLRIITISLLW